MQDGPIEVVHASRSGHYYAYCPAAGCDHRSDMLLLHFFGDPDQALAAAQRHNERAHARARFVVVDP